jgi:hypothetical protein
VNSPDRPAPPTPSEADLRHYKSMPLDVGRLRDSHIASQGDAEAFRCAVLLWCAAWHQVPAGSLPSDAATLVRLAGLGRDLKGWRKVAAVALHGFRTFSDGRLYHKVVSEKVIEAWNSSRSHAWTRECDRIRKENGVREKKGQQKITFPPKPDRAVLRWPELSRSPPAESESIPSDAVKFPPEQASLPPEQANVPLEKLLKESEGNHCSPEPAGTVAVEVRLPSSEVSRAMQERLTELGKARRMAK